MFISITRVGSNQDIFLAASHEACCQRQYEPTAAWTALGRPDICGPLAASKGSWIGIRRDGLFGCVTFRALEVASSEIDTMLLVLTSYLTTAPDPTTFVGDTLQASVLTTRVDGWFAFGDLHTCYCAHVNNGAIQSIKLLNSGLHYIGVDSAIRLTQLDDVASRFITEPFSADLLSLGLKSLSDNFSLNPLVQRNTYHALLAIKDNQVALAQSYFQIGLFKWATACSVFTVGAIASCVGQTTSSQSDVFGQSSAGKWTTPFGGSTLRTRKVQVSHQSGVNEDSKKGKRKRRDPNRPRNYMSAFNYFAVAQRNSVVTAHPNAKNNEINKMLGELWKSLPCKDKQGYEELSLQDKIRYLKEMDSYVPSEGYYKAAPRINVPAKSYGDSPSEDGSSCPEASNEAWRPRSAYNFFVRQERDHLQALCPSGTNPGRDLPTKRWRARTRDEETLYEELAEAERRRWARAVDNREKSSESHHENSD